MSLEEKSKKELIEAYRVLEQKYIEKTNNFEVLNSIISNSDFDFWKLDDKGNIVFSSDGNSKVFGYSKEEAKNLNLADFFPEFELERAKNIFHEALNGKSETVYEFTGKHKEGHLISLEMIVAPSYSQGKIVGVQAIARDINIRKKIEKARDEIENKLKNIIEHSTNVFYTHDHLGVITYISPQIESLLGYAPEELMGKWTTLLTDNPINKKAQLITQKAIDTGKPQPPYESELLTKTNNKILVEVREAPLVKNGKTVAMIGSLNDITKRKEIEQKLKDNEQFYKKISEISTDYAYSTKITDDGKLVAEWHFGSILNLTGYTKEEINDYGGLMAIIHQDDLELVTNHIEQQIAGKIITSEYRVNTKDGAIKWIRDKGTPIFDNRSKRVIRIISIAQNITNEKQAEVKLRESEEKLQVTFNSIGDAVITTDTNGVITKMNPTAEYLTGWEFKDALNMPLDDIFNIINAQTGKKAFNPVRKVIDTGEICGLTNHTVLISKDGDKRQIADSAAPIRTKDGKIIGVVLVFRDVTKEYERQVELTKSQKQLARSQKIANFGSWEFDFNDNTVSASDQAYRIYGVNTDQTISIDTIKKVPLPKYRVMMDNALKDLMIGKKPYDMEFEILRQNDGATRLIHSIAEYDKENNKVFGIIHDITEQREMEQAFRKSEEDFRMLAENARDFIVVHDLKGRILYANPMAYQFTGYSKEEFQKMSVMDFVPPEEFSQMFKRFDKRIEGENDQFLYEVTAIKKNRQRVNIEISSSQILKDGYTKSILLVIREISERIKFLNQLKQKDKAIEASIDGIAILDENEEYIYLNKSHAKIYGYSSPEELLGKKWEILYDKDELLRFKNIIMPKLADSGNWQGESVGYRKDGSKFYQELSLTKLESGGIICLVRDISERKLYEKVIRDSENKFKELVENINDLVWEVDENDCYTFINERSREYLGLEPKDVIGNKCSNFLKESEKKRYYEYHSKSFNDAAPYTHSVFTYIKADGTESIWESSGKPIYDSEGTFIGFRGISRDITERKQTEDALKESEEKNKALSETSFEGLIISENGYNLECNEAALLLFGYTYQEFIGIHTIELIAEEYKESVKHKIMTNYEDPFEALAQKKDGTTFWAEFHGRHYTYKGRRVKVTAIRDVTERKQHDIDIINAKQKAEESDILKSAFLANMSHEIRSPMNSIIGFAKLLEDEDITVDERIEYCAYINSKSRQLLSLINDIIDISMIESGIIDLNTKDFNLNDLLREVKSDFSIQAVEKNLSIDISTNLSDDKAIFTFDPLRVKQILNNLVSNAIKFTMEGSVQLGYETQNDNIRLFVSDTGIGIAPEKQEIIFERFRQIDSSYTKQFDGTGLGLTIVNELVKLFGGSIQLESKPGKGSTFYIDLPFIVNKPIISSDSGNYTKKNSNLDFTDKLFLVVEDEFTNYKLLEKTLFKRKAKILWAKNGMEALDMFIKHQADIHLIIMDLKMPVMDGYEATKEIKKINMKIPIIALTAYAMAEDEKKALDAGCDAYLTKPVSIDILYKVLINRM